MIVAYFFGGCFVLCVLIWWGITTGKDKIIADNINRFCDRRRDQPYFWAFYITLFCLIIMSAQIVQDNGNLYSAKIYKIEAEQERQVNYLVIQKRANEKTFKDFEKRFNNHRHTFFNNTVK
jgi:hypothetical protein